MERPSIERTQMERFETELKRRTRDPLERARARHKFYEKYRKTKENEHPMTTSEKEEGFMVERKSFVAYGMCAEPKSEENVFTGPDQTSICRQKVLCG
jgi:hypothetical protein